VARESNDRFKEFFSAIIEEEHEDRIVILKIIVLTNENFTDRDLPKVQKISTSLIHENAKLDEKTQQENDNWSTG
jgi:hypothetical protein